MSGKVAITLSYTVVHADTVATRGWIRCDAARRLRPCFSRPALGFHNLGLFLPQGAASNIRQGWSSV